MRLDDYLYFSVFCVHIYKCKVTVFLDIGLKESIDLFSWDSSRKVSVLCLRRNLIPDKVRFY